VTQGRYALVPAPADEQAGRCGWSAGYAGTRQRCPARTTTHVAVVRFEHGQNPGRTRDWTWHLCSQHAARFAEMHGLDLPAAPAAAMRG